MLKVVKKAWGSEEWLVNEPEYCAKVLKIKQNCASSLHYHCIKKETFIVQSGTVRLEQRDLRGIPIDELLMPGESRTIEPNTPHRFSAKNKAEILEISTHHDEQDVIRIEPSGKAKAD